MRQNHNKIVCIKLAHLPYLYNFFSDTQQRTKTPYTGYNLISNGLFYPVLLHTPCKQLESQLVSYELIYIRPVFLNQGLMMTQTRSKHFAQINLTAKINKTCLTDVIFVSYFPKDAVDTEPGGSLEAVDLWKACKLGHTHYCPQPQPPTPIKSTNPSPLICCVCDALYSHITKWEKDLHKS